MAEASITSITEANGTLYSLIYHNYAIYTLEQEYFFNYAEYYE